MGRGRPWTPEEDALIHAAAEATADKGLGGPAGSSARRLAEVAERIGRTVDAVRKRAQRIGAVSYARVGWRQEWDRRNAAERKRRRGAEARQPEPRTASCTVHGLTWNTEHADDCPECLRDGRRAGGR